MFFRKVLYHTLLSPKRQSGGTRPGGIIVLSTMFE